MRSISSRRTVLGRAAAAALGFSVLIAPQAPTGLAAARAQTSFDADMGEAGGRVERGTMVGWPGGDAIIYPTLGFFGDAQILAVGAVDADGSFSVRLPAVVPVDLLGRSTEQCSTIQSSDP